MWPLQFSSLSVLLHLFIIISISYHAIKNTVMSNVTEGKSDKALLSIYLKLLLFFSQFHSQVFYRCVTGSSVNMCGRQGVSV